ncbi:hypothetical protein SDC9_77320 [bioreactor metagenome]|uniref:Uncharacterized protein n=1 Tax=bioreactor metagenome TaxID=1076179 RepID=A0A644YQL4_9ZZZZ
MLIYPRDASRKALVITGKLQPSASHVYVNLSEGSIPQVQTSARQLVVNLSEGWGLWVRRILIAGVSYMQKNEFTGN